MKRTIFLIVCLTQTVFLWINAGRRFEFFDYSAFLDSGYRILKGQHIYTDFLFNAGPVHPYLHALFLSLTPTVGTALKVHLVVMALVALISHYFLAARFLPLTGQILIWLMTVFCFFGPVSQPWYDHNAMTFAIAGIALLEWKPLERKPSIVFFSRLFFSALLFALSVLTKTNYGVAFAFVGFVILLFRKQNLLFALAWGFTVLAVSAALLQLTGGAMVFIDQTILAYEPSARLSGPRFLESLTESCGVWILAIWAVAMLPSLLRTSGTKENWKSITLSCCSTGAALFAMATSSTNNFGTMEAFPLISVYLLALSGKTQGERGGLIGRAVPSLCAVVLIFFGIFNSAVLTIWNWRPENKNSNYAIRHASLDGWKATEQAGSTYDEAANVIDGQIPQSDTLFIFPTMSILYAATNHESYKPAPFIFHLGVSPFPGKYKQSFVEAFKQNPPQWVLIHQEMLSFAEGGPLLKWLQLDGFLENAFATVYQTEKVTLKKFKGQISQ